MGESSKRLHTKLKMRSTPLNPPTGIKSPADLPNIERFVRSGHDPVHAVYLYVQNVTSIFAEGVSDLPEMKKYAKIAGDAQDEYLPEGPPMSPLTKSFFTTWAFYDLRFDGTDTLADCMIEANDVLRLTAEQLDALKILADSRMGIYEHIGMDGPRVRLRELITDKEFICKYVSGYRGRPGELWYARLLPSLVPQVANYRIVFTTPYILMTRKNDWLEFLKRTMSPPDHEGLRRLLKFGPRHNYWNEFVFAAYHNHQFDAIFLTGIPDLNETLPHA